MSELELTRRIPMPPSFSRWKDIANEMQVGESILLESNSKARALQNAFKEVGLAGTVKKEGDNYRVWRIK